MLESVLLDQICMLSIHVSRNDLLSLRLVSPYFKIRIERDVFHRAVIAEDLLDKVSPLTQHWFRSPQKSGLSGSQILYLDIIKDQTHFDLVEIGGRLGGVDAFYEMGRLLAETSSPSDIKGTFVLPFISLLTRHRYFNLGNSLIHMTDLLDCVYGLIAHPITVRDVTSGDLVLLKNSFGLLFNQHARSMASKLKRKRLYISVRKYFKDIDGVDFWNQLMDEELVIKLWKMERWTLKLERLHEIDEDSESSTGTGSVSPAAESPRAPSPSLIPLYSRRPRTNTDSTS